MAGRPVHEKRGLLLIVNRYSFFYFRLQLEEYFDQVYFDDEHLGENEEFYDDEDDENGLFIISDLLEPSSKHPLGFQIQFFEPSL